MPDNVMDDIIPAFATRVLIPTMSVESPSIVIPVVPIPILTSPLTLMSPVMWNVV